MEALDRQYSDVLAPLKENLAPKKFGFKYVQKLTKRTVWPYAVPDEVTNFLDILIKDVNLIDIIVCSLNSPIGFCFIRLGSF